MKKDNDFYADEGKNLNIKEKITTTPKLMSTKNQLLPQILQHLNCTSNKILSKTNTTNLFTIH